MCSGRRARFAKNIRKQIMMVRRKLSMQKRKMEAADAKAHDTGGWVCTAAGCKSLGMVLFSHFAQIRASPNRGKSNFHQKNKTKPNMLRMEAASDALNIECLQLPGAGFVQSP